MQSIHCDGTLAAHFLIKELAAKKEEKVHSL